MKNNWKHRNRENSHETTAIYLNITDLMHKKILFLIATALMSWSATFADDFKIENGKFILNGKPVTLFCGEMHYPRIPQEYWRDRLMRAKAMGLNCISTYVFWNIHERQPGKFDFSGEADLAKFIRTAKEVGLYVVLRPGPYVCAEWDFGGFPFWLQKNKHMKWRSDDPDFLAACKRYLDRLGKEVGKYCVGNGGNIILVQIENEYGSYDRDRVYLGKIKTMLEEAGFNAPFITCDGAGQMPNGYLQGILPTVNGSVGEEVKRAIDRFHPGGPYFVAEFYPAWFDVWGQNHSKRNFQSPARQIDWMLDNGVSVNIYMFHGGTNFAYTNGANTVGKGYEPQPTSYDYDAPLGEYGNPTPKYYAFREVAQRHLPAGEKLPDVPPLNPIATFAPIQLNDSVPLSAAFGQRIKADNPLTMEDVNQDFGYIHYETTVDNGGKGTLVIRSVRDYAIVFVDGKRIGALDRRHNQTKMQADIPSGARLEILVENVGRINYGPDLLDNLKGITDSVTFRGKKLVGWTTTPLPLYKLKQMPKTKTPRANEMEGVALHRGTFTLDRQGDVFLDMSRWGKGAVWINGRSIGKFWQIGPQQTLYVPGPWVKKGKNEIIVFDMETRGDYTVAGLPAPILDSVGIDRNRQTTKGRELPVGQPIIEKGDCVLQGTMKNADGVQHFELATPATMRHICIEVESSYDNKNSCLAEITLYGEGNRVIPKDNWNVIYVNSEQADEGPAENIFDESSKQYWHAQWNPATTPFPHRIIIDLGEIQAVTAIDLQQRGAGRPGCIRDFRIYGRPQFFLFKQ